MKRWLLGLLALLCMVSMVACSKSAPSLEGEWHAQDALKKDYTIVFKKDKVIHGIGTGVIRDAVTKYLRRHRHVKSFEYAPQSAGGSGCTIATLG